ncbi:hypothetical protein [Sinanaerobacter sp. ZZT-01]|uniref:hypothetical protein n=1 Tax=Sinanaerobacter sp. ZZT-01 TaxID=3111540 RepID=UPI002D77D25D|nr:hypothetical protein [Sinanaerobacter sp. ZZT-01]WRR93276.1 hypothetical protein U5921_14785 [Sinanaerobacter sp. ZZT-01]
MALPDPQVKEETEEQTAQENASNHDQTRSNKANPRKNNIGRLKVKGKSSVQELRERLQIEQLKEEERCHSGAPESPYSRAYTFGDKNSLILRYYTKIL